MRTVDRWRQAVPTGAPVGWGLPVPWSCRVRQMALGSLALKLHPWWEHENMKKLQWLMHIYTVNGKFVLINPPLEGQKCAPIKKPPFFEKVFLTFSAKIWRGQSKTIKTNTFCNSTSQKIGKFCGRGWLIGGGLLIGETSHLKQYPLSIGF